MNNVEEEQTIITIVETLRSASAHGKLRPDFVRPLYNSLIKYYSVTSKPRERWEDLVFSEEDFEARRADFIERTKGEFENPRTPDGYCGRARRAIEVYFELKKNGKISTKPRRRNQTKKPTRSESLFTENVRKIWFARFREAISADGAEEQYEILSLPSRGGKVAAIIVPKATAIEDLKTAQEMLEIMLKNIEEKEVQDART